MRQLPIVSAILLTVVCPAYAQVTVDLHALQALPEQREPRRPPAIRKPPRPSTAPVVTRSAQATSTTNPKAHRESASIFPTTGTEPSVPKSSVPKSSVDATETTSKPPAPGVPATPAEPPLPESAPALASIPPVRAEPPTLGGSPPPSPLPSTATDTKGSSTRSGLTVAFAPDKFDLSADSIASIKRLVAAAPPGDDTTFNVLAYAPGKKDDPSTARRVSLSRAMAVRTALLADGVPSASIFVRALGEQYGSGSPDRVDIGVNGLPAEGANAR